MSDIKKYKDVFNAFLLTFATYAGIFEFPRIKGTTEIPNRLIAFSKAMSCNDYDQWIHFYEEDFLFERLWRNPKRYLKKISQFNGVILPDFSCFRTMPLIMQLWNIFRSRAIGCWLQRHGIKVIPNIRYGDARTYRVTCDGIQKKSVIAIGTLGNLKRKIDREIFFKGLDVVVRILEPRVIVVYGSAPDKYFNKYKKMGIKIVQFDCETSTSHKEVI